jgi:putative phosphoribosyl transferase
MPDAEVPAGDVSVPGLLTVPPAARGLVIFAHDSDSGRHSPRNAQVSGALVKARFATLLLERFDTPLPTDHVVGAIDWIGADALVGDLPPVLRDLPIGCYGASTGAAAALVAAADRRDRVGAVVSRGGSPDLARSALARVTAPTLLIVGARDTRVLELNRQAQRTIAGESRLVTVPGAGHLFEEQGAIEQVAELTREWFERWLGG